MDGNNIDAALPISDDETLLLERAAARLLVGIPEIWEQFQHDDLSAIDQRALLLLTAAALVERRLTLRIESLIDSYSALVEVVATGHRGMYEAMEAVMAQMWSSVGHAYSEWVKTHGGLAPAQSEVLEQSWRLTDQGVVAREDLRKSNEDRGFVFDWIFNRGLCAFRPRPAGAGRLIRMRHLDGTAMTPVPVSITNWDDGAKLFAQQFAGTVTDAISKAVPKPVQPPKQEMVSLVPPQIVIDFHVYPLSPEAAHYLYVLEQHLGERMSDREVIEVSEFLRNTFANRPRFTDVRNSLPQAVKNWLDRTNGGTKLRRPV